VMDLSRGCIHLVDGIDQEMDEVIAWNPDSHVGGKQQGGYRGRC
jgi:hypothetical protein